MLFHADHCRLQDKALASTYSGPIDVVRQIVRKDGILGLYAGMEATFWRYVDLPYYRSGASLTFLQPLVVERRLLRIHLPGQVYASKGRGLPLLLLSSSQKAGWFFRLLRDNS